MNSISHSQKERLLCNLTYLFCFCEANTPFPRDSLSKAFILCTLWLGTILVCGHVCIHTLVYLVVSLAASRVIMDFTHRSVIVLWKCNFMWFFFFFFKADKSILQVQDLINFFLPFFFFFFSDLRLPGQFDLQSESNFRDFNCGHKSGNKRISLCYLHLFVVFYMEHVLRQMFGSGLLGELGSQVILQTHLQQPSWGVYALHMREKKTKTKNHYHTRNQ